MLLDCLQRSTQTVIHSHFTSCTVLLRGKIALQQSSQTQQAFCVRRYTVPKLASSLLPFASPPRRRGPPPRPEPGPRSACARAGAEVRPRPRWGRACRGRARRGRARPHRGRARRSASLLRPRLKNGSFGCLSILLCMTQSTECVSRLGLRRWRPSQQRPPRTQHSRGGHRHPAERSTPTCSARMACLG